MTYAASGVDVDAGERAVALMKASVKAAQRPETLGDFGGFAGLFDASALTKYRKPLLATSTDGVGTEGGHRASASIVTTIGIDLVAMVVNKQYVFIVMYIYSLGSLLHAISLIPLLSFTKHSPVSFF